MHLPRSRYALALPVVATTLAACGSGGADRAAPDATVTIPQLVGREQEQAHEIAMRAGLQLRWSGFAGKLANGRYNVDCVKILRQSPVAGERRPKGSLVYVIEDACKTPQAAPTRPAGME